jgi:hypothetical protein
VNLDARETPALGAASGSARQCEWLIGRGRLAALCPGKATHVDPSTGSAFCQSHAEDYEEVFGTVLHTLSPND